MTVDLWSPATSDDVEWLRWIVITDCDDWLTYIGAEAEIVTALEHAEAFEVRGPTQRRAASQRVMGVALLAMNS